MASSETGSHEERECVACLDGLVYDGQAGAWVPCEACSGSGRAVVFVYARARHRLHECVGCGGRFRGKDLFEVIGEDHMTFFEGDMLCRPCAVRHGVL